MSQMPGFILSAWVAEFICGSNYNKVLAIVLFILYSTAIGAVKKVLDFTIIRILPIC